MYQKENKGDRVVVPGRVRKAGETEFEGNYHDVVENKGWKNVRWRPCHDVDENTGTYFVFSTICMKRNTLIENRCFLLTTSEVVPKGRVSWARSIVI